MEPDPQHVDLLKETFGLSAKSRSVSTPADEKRDNYDDTPVEQQDSTASRSATMSLAFTAVVITMFRFFETHDWCKGRKGFWAARGLGELGVLGVWGDVGVCVFCGGGGGRREEEGSGSLWGFWGFWNERPPRRRTIIII